MNQAVNYIVKFCLANNGNILTGELKDIKQNMNISRINNQNFQYIPYVRAKCAME